MSNGDKRHTVIIADEAVQMLISHARFLAQVSETAAHSLIEEFDKKAKSLEKLPKRNPLLDDPLIPTGKYRKLLIAKRYMLIYQVKGDIVYIDAVIDCRQDYSWILR